MILKYDKTKIYNKNEFRNAVRRATQQQLHASYSPRRIDSQVLKMLNRYFGLGLLFKIALLQVKITTKVFGFIKPLLRIENRKEESICHYRIR